MSLSLVFPLHSNPDPLEELRKMLSNSVVSPHTKRGLYRGVRPVLRAGCHHWPPGLPGHADGIPRAHG